MGDTAETMNSGTRVDAMLPPILVARLIDNLSFMEAPRTIKRGRKRANGITAEMLGLVNNGEDIQDD